MPRHKRLNVAGGIYHVIARGLERREIFKDDADRSEFVRRLEKSLNESGCKCYGWVLMPNHFHLLIRTGSKPLGNMMRRLLTGYAIYFNTTHRRSGYLYQNRYKSILCQEDVYLKELVRYVHLNPLRSGMLKDIESLNNYPWSGHCVLMGNQKYGWQSTDEILSLFGTKVSDAKHNYLNFICDGTAMGKRDDLSGGGLKRSAGGWKGIAELKRNMNYWRGDERVLGDGGFVNAVLKQSEEDFDNQERIKQKGLTISWLTDKVTALTGINAGQLAAKGHSNHTSRARAIFAYWGYKQLYMTAKALMNVLSCSRPALTRLIEKGEKISCSENLMLQC